MKTVFNLLVAAVLGAAALTPSARAQEVTLDLFYDSLADHGEWFEAADYGYVWHPADVGNDWRPYSDGQWVYTDAGWTWQSNEPFGWATYHYGRWIDLADVGWVWVPDTVWGPAWVSWRRTPEYVGWAPLPPEAVFRPRVGFASWVDSYYDIGPAYYSFVETRHFGHPRLRTVFIDRSRNFTIIRQSTNITNITYVNNIIVNRGPDYDFMVRHSATPIRRLRLDRRYDYDRGRRGDPAFFRPRITGDTLQVFAPAVRYSGDGAPPRVARRLERVVAERGWRGPGMEEREVRQLRERLRSEAQPPEALPERPQFQRIEQRTADTLDVNPPRAAGATATTTPGAEPGETPAAGARTPEEVRRAMTATGAKGDRKGTKGEDTAVAGEAAAKGEASTSAEATAGTAAMTEAERKAGRKGADSSVAERARRGAAKKGADATDAEPKGPTSTTDTDPTGAAATSETPGSSRTMRSGSTASDADAPRSASERAAAARKGTRPGSDDASPKADRKGSRPGADADDSDRSPRGRIPGRPGTTAPATTNPESPDSPSRTSSTPTPTPSPTSPSSSALERRSSAVPGSPGAPRKGGADRPGSKGDDTPGRPGRPSSSLRQASADRSASSPERSSPVMKKKAPESRVSAAAQRPSPSQAKSSPPSRPTVAKPQARSAPSAQRPTPKARPSALARSAPSAQRPSPQARASAARAPKGRPEGKEKKRD